MKKKTEVPKQSELTTPQLAISELDGSFYGNGIDSFEIAAWHDSDKNNFIRLSEYDDVLGWLSKEQVTTKINELSKL